MNITIHQGRNTLGGNCVEISNEKSSILIGAGIPVSAKPSLSNKDFNKIAERAGAIFISHPHPDHYAMLPWLDVEAPVYMSRGCKTMISIAHTFGQTNYDPTSAISLDDQPINISGNRIRPIPIDHSGFHSMAFLISWEDQHILYSGDLRDHGRRAYLTKRLAAEIPESIDTLILEGTLLSRNYKGVASEIEVEKKLVKKFSSDNLSLIAFSSQNIDRLVSVYKACLKTGKTLVIDPYTAMILDNLKSISANLPQYDWKNIGILFAANSYTRALEKEQLYRFASAKITKDMIRDNPERYVLKSNSYVENQLMKENLLDDTILVYSQWSGYAGGIWESDRVHHIHCSGHAQIETLKKLIRDVNPEKLIPIHTENVDAFQKLFSKKLQRS